MMLIKKQQTVIEKENLGLIVHDTSQLETATGKIFWDSKSPWKKTKTRKS
jgi:hypothetical protein